MAIYSLAELRPPLARQVDAVCMVTSLRHDEERHDSAGQADDEGQRPPEHTPVVLRPHARETDVGQYPQSRNARILNL